MKNFLFVLLCVFCLVVPCTNVGAQAIVYSEGFESGTTPTGWTRSGTASSSYNWKVSTKSAHSGSYSYVFDSWNSSKGKTGILVSAPITISSSGMVLSFWLKNPTGGELSVYISTDGGATYLSNPLDTNIINITDWTEFTYSLNSYVGQSISLVFYSVSNWGDGDAFHYLDDVVIREPVSCARPINLSVVNVSQTSATINWTVAMEGDTASTFILNVYDNDSNFVYQNQTITPTQASGASFNYTLSGLQANSDYNVTLKADCSVNSRGTSTLSEVFEFTTLCNSSALPFFEGFESGIVGEIPDCWHVVEAPSTSTSTTNQTGYSISKKSFKLQSTISTAVVVATKPLAHAANDMEVDFMLKADAGTTLFVGLMSNVCDTSTFERLYTAVITDGGVWKNYRFNTANTTHGTTTDLHVAFAINSGGSKICYLDNVDIHSTPSCLRLEKLEVISFDTSSVTLDWVDYSATPSGNYVVEVYNKDEETISYVNASTRPFKVTNLVEHTNYEFRIRNVCSSTDSSQWSVPTGVHTACLANMSLPFLEDFNSFTTIPPCWKELLPGWKINIYGNTNAIHTGYSLESPSSQNGHYLIASEPVYIPVANAYDVSFYMYRIVDIFSKYEKERALVWVNSTPSLEGAILLDSIHAHAGLYPEEEITGNRMMQYFYKIPLQGKVYILFETYHYNWGSSFYFDDVAVDVHVCRGILKKLALKESFSNKTIKATWNTITEETQWLVDFVLKNDNNDTLYSVNNFLVNKKEFIYDFSSVYSPSTNYNYSVRVRALCTGNDTIETGVSGGRSFSTPCNPVALPIYDDFEGSLFPSDCWTISTDTNSANPANQWQKNTNPSYLNSGVASAKFPDAGKITIGYLNTPLFHAEVGKKYLVSYYQYRYKGSLAEPRYREGVTIWLTQTPSDTTEATKLGFKSRFNNYGDIPWTGMHKVYYEFTVPQDGDYLIMIQAIQEYGGSNFVDDVLVMEVPECYNLQDNSVSINSLLNGVQVTISDNSATKVEFVVCGEDVVSDSIKESDIHHVFNVTSTNNTTTISGLQPETRYKLFWRNICNDTINNYSDWCLTPILFSTKCPAFEVNNITEFFDGFETYHQDAILSNNNSCYIIDSNKDLPIVGGIGSNTTQVGTQCIPYEGDKQLAFNWHTNGSFKRALQLKAGKNYEVSIFARMDDIIENSAHISLFYQQEGSTTKNACLPSTYLTSNTWNLYSAYFSVPTDGVYYVGLEGVIDDSALYFALDNFRVRELPCDPPIQNEIIAVTDTSFSVQVSSNYFNSWEVRVCTSEPDINLSAPQAIIVDTIASQSFTIDNLQANTDYWYIIRSLCSNIASDWSAPIHIITHCVEQPIAPIEIYDTICEGEVYNKNGFNDLTVANRYVQNFTSTLGCDSTVILYLTVVDVNSYLTVILCEGDTYYFGGQTISAAGVYTDTATNSRGCDSIVELTLDFIPTVRVAITATINEGETYEFGGNSLSQAGEYEHTFHTALGCDSVVTLTLNVTTSVDNAYALPIVVAPNPVYGGQSTFVNREWTAAEQSGMRVEVLNSVGQVVEVFTPTTFPIEVGGIYTSGVYYIRVTTGTGDIYLGRLVVR